MPREPKPLTVLMADDDEDDRLLAQEAFDECGLDVDVHFVVDGEELLQYLHGQGPFADSPMPSLILLDLNMPRKDGRETLAEIRENPSFRRIPVLVITTSKAEEDVQKSYDLGVNSFLSKPTTFEGLRDLVREITHYWFETVRLPGQPPAAAK